MANCFVRCSLPSIVYISEAEFLMYSLFSSPQGELPLAPTKLLPVDHLEKIEGWGGAVSSFGYVFRPSTIEGLRDVFSLARNFGRNITFRGAGKSYGDAAIGA